ncbi:DUF2306 domain-containing protein [Cohnella soli]|uniref:DUF2306 domain-containing protein n=1 Tax=Cohnella soli TaxID=425005 RepID=A0ABW0HX33_9BACL
MLFAFVAMVAGFLQFLKRFRQHRPRVHCVVGRIYVGSIWISGFFPNCIARLGRENYSCECATIRSFPR